MTPSTFLAIDLGAESGRAMLGRLDDKLSLEEVHRFVNGPVRIGDHIHWDVLRLWAEIQTGLRLAAESAGCLAGIGLDTWGVDYGLLDSADRLLGNPYHYRDARTNGMIEAACQIVPREEIYRQTGIQFTADATGCTVVAGPVEATAIGNIIVQAAALGQVASLAEGRALIRRSFDVSVFEPGSRQIWEDAYGRYLNLRGG